MLNKDYSLNISHLNQFVLGVTRIGVTITCAVVLSVPSKQQPNYCSNFSYIQNRRVRRSVSGNCFHFDIFNVKCADVYYEWLNTRFYFLMIRQALSTAVKTLPRTCLENFSATVVNKIFFGRHPRSRCEVSSKIQGMLLMAWLNQVFPSHRSQCLRPHLQGVAGGSVKPRFTKQSESVTPSPFLGCLWWLCKTTFYQTIGVSDSVPIFRVLLVAL